jgi:hypothetical protein
MASTGNVFPTVGASVDRAGSTAWTNPGNVTADDGTNASAVVPTDYLVTSGYGFTIPAGATIRGITVRVEASETGSGTSNFVAQLHSATTPTLIGSSKNSGTVGSAVAIETLGGVADLWGATLTPAIVNDAGFGVSIWSTDTTNTLLPDYVTIAVEWQLPDLGDGDSWWAGANRCAAGVAIAGAASALALSTAIAGSFTHGAQQDELPVVTASSSPYGGGIPPPTARDETRLRHWFSGDDLPTPPAFTPDDAEWQQFLPLAPSTVAPVAWVNDDSQSVVLDDVAEWQAPPVASFTAVPLVFVGDDIVPQPVVSVVSDDPGWQPVVFPAFSAVTQPWADDDVAPQAPTFEADTWQAPTATVLAAPQPFAADDELPQTPAAIASEADTWRPAQPQPAPIAALPWVEGDVVATAAAGSAQGGGSTYGSPGREATRVLRWPVSDDLPTPAATLPDEVDTVPLLRSIDDPTSTVWAENEEVVPRAQPEDEYWQRPFSIRVEPTARVWTQQDERPFVTALHGDDAQWPPVPSLVAPVARLWDQQDERPSVVTLSVDDAYWLSPATPAVAPVVRLWQQQDERVAAAALTVDDAQWPTPVPATLAPIVRLWQQQDDAPRTLALDESTAWVAPRVVSTRTPALASWDDGAIVPQATPLPVDDLYWQQPRHQVVQPVVTLWQRQDELVPQPDPMPAEDYWLRLYSITAPPAAKVWVHQDETPTAVDAVFTVNSRLRIGFGRDGTISRNTTDGPVSRNASDAPQRRGPRSL